VAAGAPVPEWVRAALPALPQQMADADRRAHQVDRAVVDLAEALVLQPRVGAEFAGVVVESGERGGEVQLREPAVRARVEGSAPLPLGAEVEVRLVSVDVEKRRVVFAPVA
jgi:exoribonuclease R